MLHFLSSKYFHYFFLFSNNILFIFILNKHEHDFHNSKIMEFIGFIHEKSNGLWWGPTSIIFYLKIIQVKCMIDIVWFWPILFEIFYVYHYELTLFPWQHILICCQSTLPLLLHLFIHSHARFVLLFDHFIGIHWFLYQLSHLSHLI